MDWSRCEEAGDKTFDAWGSPAGGESGDGDVAESGNGNWGELAPGPTGGWGEWTPGSPEGDLVLDEAEAP